VRSAGAKRGAVRWAISPRSHEAATSRIAD